MAEVELFHAPSVRHITYIVIYIDNCQAMWNVGHMYVFVVTLALRYILYDNQFKYLCKSCEIKIHPFISNNTSQTSFSLQFYVAANNALF